jgi:hypothetical protein
VSVRACRGNQNTRFMFNKFPKIVPFMRMWKNIVHRKYLLFKDNKYIHRMKLADCMAFSFVTFFHIFVCYIFHNFIYGCMFCMLLFNFVNYVFFIVMFMYPYCYVFNILCILFHYSVPCTVCV